MHLLGCIVLGQLAQVGQNQQGCAYHGQVDPQIEEHGAGQFDLTHQRNIEMTEGGGQEREAEQPAGQPGRPGQQHAAAGQRHPQSPGAEQVVERNEADRALALLADQGEVRGAVTEAAELFQRGIPVLQLDEAGFTALSDARFARIEGDTIQLTETLVDGPQSYVLPKPDPADFTLAEIDRRFLAGEFGEAARIAARIVLQTARIEGATELVDVEMAHLDGVFYQGPAGLKFARKLCDLGAKVRVPTTMNAVCVDRRQWRAQGVDKVLGEWADGMLKKREHVEKTYQQVLDEKLIAFIKEQVSIDEKTVSLEEFKNLNKPETV